MARAVSNTQLPRINHRWRWLRWGCECAGATFVKFGQWASIRRDIFPAEMCDALAGLTDDAVPHSWDDTEVRRTRMSCARDDGNSSGHSNGQGRAGGGDGGGCGGSCAVYVVHCPSCVTGCSPLIRPFEPHAQRVLRSELGDDWRNVLEINESMAPIGTGSVAQVYRGRLFSVATDEFVDRTRKRAFGSAIINTKLDSMDVAVKVRRETILR